VGQCAVRFVGIKVGSKMIMMAPKIRRLLSTPFSIAFINLSASTEVSHGSSPKKTSPYSATVKASNLALYLPAPHKPRQMKNVVKYRLSV
jgi:hypothetical protein